MEKNKSRLPVQYSCYFSQSREGEQFVAEHSLGYIISGAMELNNGANRVAFKTGDLYFCRRNNLLKFMKSPSEEAGEFRSLSVYLDQETLKSCSVEYGYGSGRHMVSPAFRRLQASPLLKNFAASMLGYEALFARDPESELVRVKQREAILLLLQTDKTLKDILFDFSEPGKINLEAFMNRNYHFNVDLKRFAYLTGRSLSTFKRDFEKIYNTTPSRWLLQRRLKEAYYLITSKRKAASDVYLDLGFEDLSHFSYAFKKQFGISPSAIARQ